MSEHAFSKKSLKRNGSKTKRKATTTTTSSTNNNIHNEYIIPSKTISSSTSSAESATLATTRANYTNSTESDESAATIISSTNKMPVTQFSVQSSDVNGLRMKISAIRPQKSTTTTNNIFNNSNNKIYNNNNNNNNINNNLNQITTTITTTTSTTNLTTSTKETDTTTSLIVKISKSEQLKQQLDQIAKEEEATATNSNMPDIVAFSASTTAYTCPVVTVTRAKLPKTVNSDNTESGCSETTTTTLTGGYAEFLATKKVKVKRKKAHSHESKKLLKKLRMEKQTTTKSAAKIQTVPAFTSDSDDEPLLYRHNQQHQQQIKQILLPPMHKPALIAAPLCVGSDHIGLSSSDNELPQLVSAAIERVARASESDDDDANNNYGRNSRSLKNIEQKLMTPRDSLTTTTTTTKKKCTNLCMPQYQSTLLQDFMEKTQSLGQQNAMPLPTKAAISTMPAVVEANAVKKRRGRPKKIQTITTSTSATTTATVSTTTTTTNMNVIESADSGVVSTTSTTQSSTPSPRRLATTTTTTITTAAAAAAIGAASWTAAVSLPQIKSRNAKNVATTWTTALAQTTSNNKLDMSYLDKRMYATERVLYPPPRNKRRQQSLTPSKEEANIDPVWRKIDVNKKFRRPNLCGYKSDGGGGGGGGATAASSSTICSKVLAAKCGYVSDYGSFNARATMHAHNSGYKSDASCKSRYSTKSCMSRRSSGKRRNRRRSLAIKPAPEACSKDEEDILQLAGLSLGHSSEESNEYVCKPNLATLPTTSVSKKYGEINRYIVTGEYFGGRGFTPFALKSQTDFSAQELMYQNSRKLKSRRSSAASVCSSYYSNTSRVRRKHRHRSSRLTHAPRNSIIDSKLSTEIDILTNTLSSIRLSSAVSNNSNNVNHRDRIFGAANLLCKSRERRAQKKRKTGEQLDFALLSATANAAGNLTPSSGASSSKRRHKKASSLSSSPDDHKLPLKKRHYLLSGPGDKCADAAVAAAAAVAAKLFASNTEAWAAAAAAAKTNACAKVLKAVTTTNTNAGLTPKKRHLLQSNLTEATLPLRLLMDANNGSKTAGSADLLTTTTTTTATLSKKKQQQQRLDAPFICEPPPGVFEPSVALEIQIPPMAKLGEVAGIITKSEVESPLLMDLNKNFNVTPSAMPKTENVRVVETLLNKTGGNLILKRKRKKINRTGFPTVRRKKRKINENLLLDVTPDISEQVQRLTQQQKLTENVPQKARLSVVALERLQGVVPDTSSAERQASPASSGRSRKMSRKNEKTRISMRKTTTTEVARIKEEEINTLSPKLITTDQLLTTVGIKKETTTTNNNNNETIVMNKTKATTKICSTNKIKLPSKVKLPAGLDPNINFCCKIRLKRGAVSNANNNNKTNNNNKNINYTENIQTSLEIAEEAAGKDVELNYMEHDILPEEQRLFETDDVTINNEVTQKATNAKNLKKNYLFAGLFSDFYKRTTTTTTNTTLSATNLLPPPPYCERYLRHTVLDFELPYDIWWAYKHAKLPTRVTVPSWNYRKIRTNIYAESVRPNTANSSDMATCYCKAEMACGDNCLNRVVYTECSPSSCPAREHCRNQKIQKHEVAPGLERFMTKNKGWGMRTKLPIDKGTYILEYVGEVVTEREFKHRMATIYLNDIHHYCLHLDGGLVIDGHRMGSDGRFVNHSCQPNCEMQKWSVNGLSRMALFAKRYIEAGEELSYDYNFALFNPAEGQPCRCNAPLCRGVIGGKSQRIKPLPVSDNSKVSMHVKHVYIGSSIKDITIFSIKKTQKYLRY